LRIKLGGISIFRIAGNGQRCSKAAKLDFNQNVIMIRVCLQHVKLVEEEKNNKK